MKKFLLSIAGFALAGGAAFASLLSPQEALDNLFANGRSRIKAFDRASISFVSAEGRQDSPALYLFNTKEGFLVVSADDETTPLLGYSDAGTLPYDTAEMAPAFRYWISSLSERIDNLREQPKSKYGVIAKATRPNREPIATLCATRWNQDAPYYNKCPLYYGSNTYTGCVATAMAQAMKYHNWPDRGEGKNGYRWNRQDIISDFSTHTYDWSNMKNIYTGGEYTQTEADAVALIMSDAGVSVNMSYSTQGSGAQSIKIASALGKYFRYDKNTLRYYSRDCFGLLDWEEMIYNSLKNDGPVIYNGQSYQGGHSFICDGYDKDGYFHFNWGWGGVSDGYFLLDALDPYDQGIGGSASNTGFNFQQDIIIGIRPDRNGNGGTMKGAFAATNNFTAEVTNYPEYGNILMLSFGTNGYVYNYGPGATTVGCELALKFEPLKGGDSIIFGAQKTEEEVPVGSGYRNLAFEVPDSTIADGKYKMTLVYRDGEPVWTPVALPLSAVQFVMMNKNGDELSFADGVMTVSYTHLTLPTIYSV